MRHTFTAVLMVTVLLTATLAFAGEPDQYNTKVLLNGSKQVAEQTNWQYVGTAVFPNIGHGPVLMMGGIGYAVDKTWNVKTMLGTFSKDQTGQLVVDLRASYDALDPVHLWADVEYYSKSGDWYAYMDVNYRIGNLGLIGVETENTLVVGAKDNLSIGPRVVLPLSEGRLVLIGAYQFHNNGNQNQVWSRAAINF